MVVSRFKPPQPKIKPTASCYDCGLDYGGNGWIEAIIPDKVWNVISPTHDQNGILCITCIARRLNTMGYKNIPVWFRGTEPLRPIYGNIDLEGFNLFILRNWEPEKD